MKGLKDKKKLATLDTPALNKEILAARQELYVLKMKLIANELKQTHLIKAHKSYIARLATYLNNN